MLTPTLFSVFFLALTLLLSQLQSITSAPTSIKPTTLLKTTINFVSHPILNLGADKLPVNLLKSSIKDLEDDYQKTFDSFNQEPIKTAIKDKTFNQEIETLIKQLDKHIIFLEKGLKRSGRRSNDDLLTGLKSISKSFHILKCVREYQAQVVLLNDSKQDSLDQTTLPLKDQKHINALKLFGWETEDYERTSLTKLKKERQAKIAFHEKMLEELKTDLKKLKVASKEINEYTQQAYGVIQSSEPQTQTKPDSSTNKKNVTFKTELVEVLGNSEPPSESQSSEPGPSTNKKSVSFKTELDQVLG